MKNLKYFLIFLFSGLIFTGVLNAQKDIYLKYERHTEEYKVMGKTFPAKVEIIQSWLTPEGGRFDTGDEMTAIVRNKEQKMYFLNHKEKTYSEISLMASMIDEFMEEEEYMTEEEKKETRKEFEDFAAVFMSVEATVTETDEQKKINDWDCKKYILATKMAMGKSTAEIWATEDLAINSRLYMSMNQAATANFKGFEQMMEEVKKIKGVQVLTNNTTEMMGNQIRMTEKLIDYAKKTAPKGILDLPEGYKSQRRFQ